MKKHNDVTKTADEPMQDGEEMSQFRIEHITPEPRIITYELVIKNKHGEPIGTRLLSYDGHTPGGYSLVCVRCGHAYAGGSTWKTIEGAQRQLEDWVDDPTQHLCFPKGETMWEKASKADAVTQHVMDSNTAIRGDDA